MAPAAPQLISPRLSPRHVDSFTREVDLGDFDLFKFTCGDGEWVGVEHSEVGVGTGAEGSDLAGTAKGMRTTGRMHPESLPRGNTFPCAQHLPVKSATVACRRNTSERV